MLKVIKNGEEIEPAFTLADGLGRAVTISLFTHRRAGPGDTLPGAPLDAGGRGWWADAVPVVGGDLIGSRLWLLERAGQSPQTLRRAEGYALEALAWLKDDGVAEEITVTAEWPRPGMLGLTVGITPPSGEPERFRFEQLLEEV